MAKSKWKSCTDDLPDSERQVVVARPDKEDVEAAKYLRPENCWVEAGTNNVIWPSLWCEMPDSPFTFE